MAKKSRLIHLGHPNFAVFYFVGGVRQVVLVCCGLPRGWLYMCVALYLLVVEAKVRRRVCGVCLWVVEMPCSALRSLAVLRCVSM